MVELASEASEVELDLRQGPQLQLRKEPPRVSAEASTHHPRRHPTATPAALAAHGRAWQGTASITHGRRQQRACCCGSISKPLFIFFLSSTTDFLLFSSARIFFSSVLKRCSSAASSSTSASP